MKSIASWLKLGAATLILAGTTAVWAQDDGGMPPPAPVNAKEGRGQGQGEFRQRMADRMRRGDMATDRFLERIVQNPKLAEQLKLTDEQMAKLKTAFEEGKAEEKKLLEEQQSGGTDQARILMGADGEVDEQAILAAVEKAGKARTELAKLRVKQLLLVRATLTPEQREKVKEIIRERAQSMREGPGPEGRGRGMNRQGRDREAGPGMGMEGGDMPRRPDIRPEGAPNLPPPPPPPPPQQPEED